MQLMWENWKVPRWRWVASNEMRCLRFDKPNLLWSVLKMSKPKTKAELLEIPTILVMQGQVPTYLAKMKVRDILKYFDTDRWACQDCKRGKHWEGCLKMGRTYTELACGCFVSCEGGGGLIDCGTDGCQFSEYIAKHRMEYGRCVICHWGIMKFGWASNRKNRRRISTVSTGF